MPIFDQGYQHWNGPLSGHAWRWFAIARHGVRTQLRNRYTRLVLLVAWLPAIGLITMLSLWGLVEQRAESVMQIVSRLLPAGVIAEPQEYRSAVWTISYGIFFRAELFCLLILVLLVGPNLISRDLRFNALPLYFSRPLRRFDYFAGKLGVIGFFLAATVLVPAVAAYVLGVVFSLDLTVVRDTHRLLWASIVYSTVILVSAGTLMLALSSVSRRTIYVGLFWVGLCLLSWLVSGAMIGIRSETTRHEIRQRRIAEWLADHPPPKGIPMVGQYPQYFYNPKFYHSPGSPEPQLTDEEKAQKKWLEMYWQNFSQADEEGEATALEEQRDDWRPVVSYATNLQRMGDLFLDTESAWLTFGRALEQPRRVFGPMMSGSPRTLPRRPNAERILADRMTWQYPWYWSGAVLAGLVLLSLGILTRQVKSLDRLK
jgi:ABC-type transport system involved in multi-copper enzyme maturation permease subunit